MIGLLDTPRRRSCWLALAAMLALSVLPVVSQAIVLARGNPLPADVCTTPGSRAAADGAPDGQPHAPADCLQCASAAGSAGLPPGPGLPVLHATAAESRRAITQAAAPPTAVWHRVQARAPPTHC